MPLVIRELMKKTNKYKVYTYFVIIYCSLVFCIITAKYNTIKFNSQYQEYHHVHNYTIIIKYNKNI